MEDDTTPDPEMAARTRELVRQKQVVDIKERMGRDIVVYEAIRAASICATKAKDLLGGQDKLAPALAGMVETGDGRIFTGGLKMALTSKQVRTSSIDEDWYCYKCSQHNVRPAIRTRGEAGESPIQAVVLSDQNFPAILPVNTGDQCIKVLRIENGSVPALVE
jgi:hypothetical protein